MLFKTESDKPSANLQQTSSIIIILITCTELADVQNIWEGILIMYCSM